MLTIAQANIEQNVDSIRELFWEYLEWANGMVSREFGVKFDIEAMLKTDMTDLAKFLPPSCGLFLAYHDGQLAGLACLRRLKAEVGEVKRMYVRPAFRGQSIGRALLPHLLDVAHHIGYARIRLHSARFMAVAHVFYRSI